MSDDLISRKEAVELVIAEYDRFQAAGGSHSGRYELDKVIKMLQNMPSLCPSEYVKAVERKLRRNPEYIIQLLEENLDTKERVLNRIKRFGGIKWYRYLDMSNPVIQWVNENLEGMEDEEN